METLAACAVAGVRTRNYASGVLPCGQRCGAPYFLACAGVLEETMAALGSRIDATLCRHVPEGVEVGFVCFTNAPEFRGVLTKSSNADELMELWKVK